jgi:Zn-dependent protease with chaperone function
METGWLMRGATWIATYYLHSVGWGAVGALLARRRELPAAARHSILKCALFGPLLTTGLAVLSPVVWQWPAQSGLPSSALRAFAAEGTPLTDALRALPGGAHGSLRASAIGCALLFGCWLSALVVGLLRLGVSGVLLERRLRSRRPIESGRMCERLAAVLRRSALRRVRLTACAEVKVPFAIGLREICVPATSLASLSDAELDAVLAHELAHLERRDGLWFPAIQALQALFWLQPLNHWLSWRVRHWAELACDDRALELTGDPLTLARALTRVAERASASGWGFAPSAARSATSLLERVRRLAALRAGAPLPAPAGRIRGRLATLTALGAVLCSLRLELAQAAPALVAGVPAELPASEANLDATPGGEDFCRQLNDLVQVEQHLQEQLSRRAAAEDERRAELRSDLEEARARRVWAEERYELWMNGGR